MLPVHLTSPKRRGSGFGVQGSGFMVQRRRWPKKRPVKSNEKLMNVEHRTSNVELRIMYSACRELLCRTVYFKKTERSDFIRLRRINRHSSFPEVSYEDLKPRYPYTRNLKPKTNELRYSCPAEPLIQAQYGKTIRPYRPVPANNGSKRLLPKE